MNQIELSFYLVLGTPGVKGDGGFCTAGGHDVDFFEYLDSGLGGWDIWEFLLKSITEIEAESLATEIVYFKDVVEGGYPGCPNARLAKLDFGQIEPTPKRMRAAQRLGKACDFGSKFHKLQKKFREVVTI